MSNAAGSTNQRSTVVGERTRRQLQELDSLLEKMLSLPSADGTGMPVSDGPKGSQAPSPPSAAPTASATGTESDGATTVDFQRHTGGRQLHPITDPTVELVVADPASDLSPLTPIAPVKDDTGLCLRDLGKNALRLDADATAGPPAIEVDEEESALQGLGATPLFERFARERAEGHGSWALRAARHFDQRAEQTLRTLGPIGRAVFHPTGKALLGWLGLVLLLGSAGLLLGLWLGWSW